MSGLQTVLLLPVYLLIFTSPPPPFFFTLASIDLFTATSLIVQQTYFIQFAKVS